MTDRMTDRERSAHRLNPQIAALPLPAKMADLPIGPNGFPVPWFTPWVGGVPEFRAMDGPKIALAVKESRCWVCGQHRGRNLTFVIGPMCLVNRISSEPPSHLECARYSARACPFLARPKMVRRDHSDLDAEGAGAAGFMIERNPGVTLLYTTRGFEILRAGDGVLFALDAPTAVEWYREGRPATRAEVEEAVATGLPTLEDLARQDPRPGALAHLARLRAAAEGFFPAA